MQGKRKYTIVDDFFKKWSVDMAYIAGFFIADATVDGNYSIKIHLSQKDTSILEYIRSHLSPNSPIIQIDRNDIRTDKVYRTCLLRINSSKMIKDLNKLGIIAAKSGQELLPNCPKKYLPDLIRGIFDGDGSWNYNVYKVGKRRKFDIVSQSKDLLKQIQNILGVGIIRDCKNVFRLQSQNKRDMEKIANFIYNGNFCLQRKYDKYLEIIKSYE